MRPCHFVSFRHLAGSVIHPDDRPPSCRPALSPVADPCRGVDRSGRAGSGGPGRQQSHRRAAGRDEGGGHFLRSGGSGLWLGGGDPRGLERWRGDLDGAGGLSHGGGWRECGARDGESDCVECGSGLVGELQHPDAFPGGGGWHERRREFAESVYNQSALQHYGEDTKDQVSYTRTIIQPATVSES